MSGVLLGAPEFMFVLERAHLPRHERTCPADAATQLGLPTAEEAAGFS